MGSCASLHKEDPGFHKKQFLGSPHKAKAANGKAGGGGGVAPVGDCFGDLKYKIEGEQQQQQQSFGLESPDSGSKDEMFFESRAWLDSDCEDGFYSVNGDFTPSRGSTPNHQPRTQTLMTNVFQPNNVHNSKSSELSPTGRRKLAELLQESMHNDSEEGTDISNNEKQQTQPVAAEGKPMSESSSACSMESTPISVVKSRKDKAWYTGRCCLPSFVHNLSIDESESRQKMSHGPCAV